MTTQKQALSRRKFLKGTAIAGGAAAATLAAPAVVTAQSPDRAPHADLVAGR